MPFFTGGLALLGGLVGGATQIGGDLISAGGQSATNQDNMAIAQKQMDFQAQQMQLAEGYDTQMSNTAVQRRVADMQAAGINPVMAAGNPASAPMISSGQGASIAMQNPNAAFSNLGGQLTGSVGAVTQAASAVAQNNVANANADNIRADTANKLATLPYSGATAKQNLINMQETQANLYQQGMNLAQDYDINDTNRQLKTQQLSQNTEFQSRMQDLLLQMQQVDLERAKLGLPALRNDAAFQNSPLGKILPYSQAVTGQLQNLGSAVRGFSSSARDIKDIGRPNILPRGAVNMDTGETTPPWD